MTSPDRSRLSNPKIGYVALGALILLGLILRLIRLDFQPLWWDEGYSVWFAGLPLADMVRLTAEDIHPPLYYALLHPWSALLGLSPVALRLFSALAALASIPLAYLAGRDMEDRWTGLIAAAFVAVNGFAIFYSQEIRMYGLAGVFSLAALWTGWRWAQPGAKRRFGIAYTLSILAGMYTLYYFALLALAQTIWVMWMARDRWRAWFIALAAAALLYLPWLIYAGPKLLEYVAYKVVQDNDQPLSLLPYFGRHLSAFAVGHLEGSLSPLWPWALLLLLPPAIALVLSLRSSPSHPPAPSPSRPLAYLTLALALPLIVGFIQQLRAPFIPDRFERVLLFAAPALWLLIAIGLRRLAKEALPAAIITAILLVIANAASLTAFYTAPRYVERDYRSLISTVQQHVTADDSIFTIFPWQTGYFWAYLPAALHETVVPSPAPAWGPDVQNVLDDILSRGEVWFPEHRALGAVLETEVEDYLGQHSYQILNQWHGDETRLTAWSRPSGAEPDSITLTTPVAWSNGIILAEGQLATMQQGSLAYLDLTWTGEKVINPNDVTFSLWLTGLRGKRWAQRDVTPFAHPAPALDVSETPWSNNDRIALFIPPGTPPGEYDIWAALLDGNREPVALAGDNPAPQAWLGNLTVMAPTEPQPKVVQAQVVTRFPASITGEKVDFLGHDRSSKALLPGDDLNVSLYWLPTAALAPDQYLFLQLLDAQNQVVAGLEEPPIPWLPTSQWPLTAPLRSQHSLRIPANLKPGEYDLIAGLFDPASAARHLWGAEDHLRLGEVSVAARAHSFDPPSPQHPLDLTLAGEQQLVGYDLIAGNDPGSPINLILFWRAAGPTDMRYSAFVHLLDAEDMILDQSDQEPAAGENPTTSWLAGEYITDTHTLTIPPDAPTGPYHLALGLYDPVTGQRLPFIDEQGNILTDHIVLPIQ